MKRIEKRIEKMNWEFIPQTWLYKYLIVASKYLAQLARRMNPQDGPNLGHDLQFEECPYCERKRP